MHQICVWFSLPYTRQFVAAVAVDAAAAVDAAVAVDGS